jgi:hypothetical protein
MSLAVTRIRSSLCAGSSVAGSYRSDLIGLRFDLDGGRGPLLEFTLRRWSNAWLKPPNRGQNFFTLSVSF